MTQRWNIACIFFLGSKGRRREVRLRPNTVNIITGASGTGKSALIKAIDYCLGSSRCELPVHVRRRATAVGVKWICGDSEFIVGRLIPPVGQATSTQMFVTSGKELPIPKTVEEFDGATTLEAAKAFIERAFGIGDVAVDPDAPSEARGRATVRHVTPYLFVTKEVIDSESVLLHGMEKADKARDIVATLPYFLRVSDEQSVVAERRLRQLRRALDREEASERVRIATDSELRRRALSLLTEAQRLGMTDTPSETATESELTAQIVAVSSAPAEALAYKEESELGDLHTRRRETLNALSELRRQQRTARLALQEASGFEGAVTRQRDKLSLAAHFRLQDIGNVCPVCDAPSERGKEMASTLLSTLSKIGAESEAVERVKPKLLEHERQIGEDLGRLNGELRRLDDQIRSWLRQNDDARQLNDLSQLRAHLLGRISYFLESSVSLPRQTQRDLQVLRAEITELESTVNREAKEIRLRRAESQISSFATEAIEALPTVAPCIGSELYFTAKQPDLSIVEAGTGAVLRMPDVGSDQNYLAMHVALSFALHRYFEAVEAPVPGLLIFDQISRPYFPANGDDVDEMEIAGQIEDEDVQAMRRHIDFLFLETERRAGLQVLLIEHAYFADDPRYVDSTRERWKRSSGKALIPLDWPVLGEA